jgi:hypothetical protein
MSITGDVDHRGELAVDGPPHADPDLVAGTEEVVGADGGVVHRGEGAGRLAEKIVAELADVGGHGKGAGRFSVNVLLFQCLHVELEGRQGLLCRQKLEHSLPFGCPFLAGGPQPVAGRTVPSP